MHLFIIVNFVIGPLKLKLRHGNLIFIIMLLVYYNVFGHPLPTMDVVLATIVTGGQANIN